MKLFINITTEDGELLERLEVTVQDDWMYPISKLAKADIIHEVEASAKIVQHRAVNP